MSFTSTRLPYRQTGAFSRIALDYIDQASPLMKFSGNSPTVQGIRKTIAERKKFPVDRKALVETLKNQYANFPSSGKLIKNIESLLLPGTFTVTTAHQPNLFTGPLYFLYKIIHAIKLADHLNASLSENHFVPVFYLGSEDADAAELNHIFLGGEKLSWESHQAGAVGRMKADKELIKLIGRMEGELSVLPDGPEIIGYLKTYYKEGVSIQDAIFGLVNALFGESGLVVLLPDNAVLKRQMIPLFRDELLKAASSTIVKKTAAELEEAGYKVQAHPREINLFYLKDGMRERIVREQDEYIVLNSPLRFSEEQIGEELSAYPERFSPNVILRGLYQETILPNIAFIGGAGEIAYWLQLKELFVHTRIPFPVLLLRNSFLLVEKKWQEIIAHLGFSAEEFFLGEQELLQQLVLRETGNQTRLNGSLGDLEQLYQAFRKQASSVDQTLEKHVDALKEKSIHRLQELEKKMMRAEKRKFADQQRQIRHIRQQLFPGDGLQERMDNMVYYYAKWGKNFLRDLYDHSLSFEQEFVILVEREK